MTDQRHDMPAYSAADIEKYWQGLLSPAEMHALEKAALDDPFLADALEGYRQMATAAAGQSATELNKLEHRLSQRISSQKKASITWWKPAAAALLILGTGTIGFLLLRHPAPSRPDEAAVPVQQKDSVSPLVNNNPPAKDSAIVLPNDVAVAEPKAFHPHPVPAPVTSAAIPQHEIASATADTSTTVVTDLSAAAEKPATESTPGTEAAKVAIPDSSSLARNNSKKEDALNEVVVTGYGKARKAVAVKQETQAKNLSVEVQQAIPVKGWNDYNQYLKEQAVIPDSLKAVHGQVVLLLTVKTNGKISAVTVEQSLHPVLDEEAIRLVKEGPAWKILKGRKASAYVIVPF